MTIVEQIKAELEAFDKKKQDLVEQLRKEFPAMFKELFEQSEIIKSIGWTQYSPYFNDGDDCVFSVHNDDLYVNGEHCDDIEFLSPWNYGKLVTEEDVINNDLLAEKTGRTWNKGKQIGQDGLVVNPSYNEKEATIYNQFIELLQTIPDEFYEELFGNHSQVTINNNGEIEVDGYDHD
jgi:molybdopterin converting factor small subunit